MNELEDLFGRVCVWIIMPLFIVYIVSYCLGIS